MNRFWLGRCCASNSVLVRVPKNCTYDELGSPPECCRKRHQSGVKALSTPGWLSPRDHTNNYTIAIAIHSLSLVRCYPLGEPEVEKEIPAWEAAALRYVWPLLMCFACHKQTIPAWVWESPLGTEHVGKLLDNSKMQDFQWSNGIFLDFAEGQILILTIFWANFQQFFSSSAVSIPKILPFLLGFRSSWAARWTCCELRLRKELLVPRPGDGVYGGS